MHVFGALKDIQILFCNRVGFCVSKVFYDELEIYTLAILRIILSIKNLSCCNHDGINALILL